MVDFHKRIEATSYDYCAELIGFARFGPASARLLVGAIGVYIESGRTGVIYEEPLRDVILASERFGFVDSEDLPWIEIDFPEDLERARTEIQPRLLDAPALRR